MQMGGEDSIDMERLTADGAEIWEDWRRGGIRFRKRYIARKQQKKRRIDVLY